MKKLYFTLCLISCLVCQHLSGQQASMSQQRLASYPLFEYNPNLAFIDFYESILPGDTVFRLSIRYDGYEDHLLSCLQSPLFRHVQELSISGAFDEVPLSITHLKQLKALFIYNHHENGCKGDCPLYIPNEVYHLPELEVLSLSTRNTSITDSIVNLKKLKHLHLSPVSLLPCLFTDMPQLRSIALNIYIPIETKYLNVCGKLLVFNITGYHNDNSWYYGKALVSTSAATSFSKNGPLNEKTDIKLNYPSGKKHTVFSFNGEIKNNEATGPWTVTCDYSLQANYSNGKSDLIKVMHDTVPLATITRNNMGEEFQEFRNVKKQFKNGIPYGNWEYNQYNGVCYKQIVYDDPEQPNSMNAVTTSYFIKKLYVNGQAYGTWTESTGDRVKTTEFENGKPVKITDRKRTFTIPIMIKEFTYDQTRSGIDTYNYPNAFQKSYLYSKESYNNYIPDGEFMSYHPNGTIREKKVYRDGKITGDVIGNYENGKTAYIKSYEQGRIKHERRFHRNGIMAQEVHYNAKGRHGTENAWSETGKLTESTYYENGLPFGVSQKFNDSGRVISEKYYEQGINIYNEESGFDHIFVISEKNKLFNFFYLFKMEQPFRNKNCVQEKKVINDSTFMVTEYQYTENHGRHLKYIKEFSFKNYRLSGTQVLKDSAGNIIQYVNYKAGLKEGKFTLVHDDDSLSINYRQNHVIDTIVTYYIKRGRYSEIHYYKNMQLYKAERLYVSHTGKPIDNIIIEYVKARQPKPVTNKGEIYKPFGLMMKLPKYPNSMFFIPETLTQYLDGKKIRSIKFHASVTEADCINIKTVKGYAIADGKKERFSKEDMSAYESCFRQYSVFNIFFNGIVTCYY